MSERRRRAGHRPPPLRAAAATASLLLIVASVLPACTPAAEGERHDAGADSSLAATSSRAGTAAAPASAASAAPADPLADSANALDRRFQELRSAINRDARALESSTLDRRSPEYATRYDDLRRRTVAAESLRAARDQLRRRIARRATPAH